MTRNIKYIVLHCTATSQTATVDAIRQYWSTQLGWRNPGYHYIIDSKGEVHQLLDEDGVANGVRGYNAESIHVSYIGGISQTGEAIDNRTPEQGISMYKLVVHLRAKYPKAKLLGHCDFPGVVKSCPCFDAQQWYLNHNITLTT